MAVPALPTFVATQPVLDAFHLSNSSPFAFASIADVQVSTRGLPSFTVRLNLSAFCGIGVHVGVVKGVFRRF